MAHREIRHLTDELDSLRKNEGYCGRGFSDALTVYLKKKRRKEKRKQCKSFGKAGHSWSETDQMHLYFCRGEALQDIFV